MHKTIYFNQLYFVHTINIYKWMPYTNYRKYILDSLSRLGCNIQSYESFDIKSYKIDNNTLLDIYNEDNQGILATIGNTSSSKLLRRMRNIETLEYIEQDAKTVLEEYTFFYLNYSTGVITTLYSKGAPRLTALNTIFSYDGNYIPHIKPIRQKNIKGMLTRTTALASIGLKFALPPSSCFSMNKETASADVVNRFLEQGFEDYELILYNHSPERKKSNLSEVIDSLIDTYEYAKSNDTPLKRIDVTFSQSESRQQTVNLLELMLTLQIGIKIDDNFSEQTIFDILSSAFEQKKQDIMQNIRPITDHYFQ